MTKRKVVAMATVAALPLFVGSTSSARVPKTEMPPHTIERPAAPSPHWKWAVGLEGEEEMLFDAMMEGVCDLQPYAWTCKLAAAL